MFSPICRISNVRSLRALPAGSRGAVQEDMSSMLPPMAPRRHSLPGLSARVKPRTFEITTDRAPFWASGAAASCFKKAAAFSITCPHFCPGGLQVVRCPLVLDGESTWGWLLDLSQPLVGSNVPKAHFLKIYKTQQYIQSCLCCAFERLQKRASLFKCTPVTPGGHGDQVRRIVRISNRAVQDLSRFSFTILC